MRGNLASFGGAFKEIPLKILMPLWCSWDACIDCYSLKKSIKKFVHLVETRENK